MNPQSSPPPLVGGSIARLGKFTAWKFTARLRMFATRQRTLFTECKCALGSSSRALGSSQCASERCSWRANAYWGIHCAPSRRKSEFSLGELNLQQTANIVHGAQMRVGKFAARLGKFVARHTVGWTLG